ncbi:hypothetical protein N5F23_15655 [Pseudomonas sichuanensis]|uniref:hypothetical protein n=1 Tax=Pseudomonas sichuanensis TaxID=2213015 RepID=UPI00244D30A7|nr:hypothetical protein [Pseudomonas sichuanensis]MDH0731459.1 hypothetical protein [Pseudomonas sichuanensis]MDH1584013.1 hypothetical protein [Pseudomonas sichuanensis]MDH1591882.1 hypothetical protein [Pseudomonas sichuanensis]MDH1597344.1 hypothetical protein [Pseudomonas sichuanensis]
MFNSPLPSANELPSSRQLVRSTAIAFAVAMGLLVTVVMPSEYAVDPTGLGRAMGLTQMGEIKISLAQEALADEAAAKNPVTASTPAPTVVAVAPPASAPAQQVAAAQPTKPAAPAGKSDETSLTLQPGEGREIKLEMRKGSVVTYAWSASGPVNHDTHGETYNAAQGDFHSYSKGRQVKGDKGELTALFDGTHGWFWRNRTSGNVTIVLSTAGDYLTVKK